MNKSHLLKIARTLYEINSQNDMNNHSPSAPGSVWVTLGSLSDSSLGSHCAGTVGLDFPFPHQRVQFESPNPQNTSSTQTLYFFSALTPFWRNSYESRPHIPVTFLINALHTCRNCHGKITQDETMEFDSAGLPIDAQG
jgi:hypothetical protein